MYVCLEYCVKVNLYHVLVCQGVDQGVDEHMTCTLILIITKN